MRFIDFFSGIGGFRVGLEMAGHECVGHCEIDKWADKSYRAMHEVKGDEWFADDIARVRPDDLPEAEVYCGGFPCQAFSIAGKRGGFADTRGTLFFEIMRLAAVRKPKYLFLENVRGLLSHDGGRTFGTILATMGELGFSCQWQILNTKDFGPPQNRERIFIVGYSGKGSPGQIFPITKTSRQTLNELIGGSQGYRVYGTDGISCTLASEAGGMGAKTGLYLMNKNKGRISIREDFNCIDANYHKGLDCHQARTGVLVKPVITPDRETKRQNGRRFKDDGEDMFTLTAQDRHGVAILAPTRTEYGKAIRKQYEAGEIEESRHNMTKLEPRSDGMTNTISTVQKDNLLYEKCRIRRLTPKECFRLQGFPDELFEKAAEVNSDSQLYKQAGNSVSVPVVYEIAKRLK